MDITPPIPDPKNTLQCLKALKESIDIREGRRGKKDAQGKYPERFVTASELIALLSNSEAIVSAVNTIIAESSYVLKQALARTISGGIITAADSGVEEYWITLTSESGLSDQLDRITGLEAGRKISLYAAEGHEITVKNGIYLKLEEDFVLTGYNSITLRSWGSSICAEESRANVYDIEAEWGALPDWLAAASHGFYCDPLSTMAERSMYFASGGLIGSLS